ncbi:MAG: two-component regulator propeller domain-containing protein [Anaerolineae bacterium]
MRLVSWLRGGLALVVLLALAALPSLGAPPEEANWSQFRTADGLPCDTVWAMAADAQSGDVWLGTSQGAGLYRNGRWYTYTPAHGLGGEWVAALAVEPGGRVWFGTSGGGLSVLDGDAWRTYTAANSGLASDWISALALGVDGRLWCGTWGHGVSLFYGGRWRTYDSSNSLLPIDYVTALAAARDGVLWIGLHGQGLARLEGDYLRLLGTAQGLSDSFVNALVHAPDGSLWVGTAKGLDQFDASGRFLRSYKAADGLPGEQVLALAVDASGALWVGTNHGAARLLEGRFVVYRAPGDLAHDYVSALAVAPDGVWVASLANGVARLGAGTVASPRRLPVVLVHGWHGPDSDRLEDSEFRFLASWLHEDGLPVYYATGVSPKNTLHQNAEAIGRTIEKAKAETGAARVDIIAFSMGGLNTRAYVESALHAGDVDQVFILGTPQAGIHLWYPFLLRDYYEWARDPSAVELTPEYAALFNDLHANNLQVPYTLVAGSANGNPDLPRTLRTLPAGDGLVEAASALALAGENVHRVLTDDLHAWSDQTILLGLPSLLYPRRTYDAYLRNPLRLGPDVVLPGEREAEPPALALTETPQHSPFYSGTVAPGETLTFTVPVDAAGEVRFYLRGERSNELTFHLVDPLGRMVDQDTIGDAGEHFDLGMASFQSYLIRDAAPGDWQVVVGRPADATGSERFTGYCVLQTPLRLTLTVAPGIADGGEPVQLTATLRWGEAPVTGASVEAEIGRPDGRSERVVLADDGLHGDGAAADGVYGARYLPAGPGGWHVAFVTARKPGLARTVEQLFAVSPKTATLTGRYSEEAEDADRDGRYDALVLHAGLEVRAAGRYLLAATLADAAGRELARVVQPLALQAGGQTVDLRFPARVLARAQTDGPYTVRRVILLDEQGAAIPLHQAHNVLTTRPIRWQDWEP